MTKLDDIDLNALASKLEEKTRRYIEENFVQKPWAPYHPRDAIMPVIKYCLLSVKNSFEGEGEVDEKTFKQMFRMCINDVLVTISTVSARVVDKLFDEAINELKKIKVTIKTRKKKSE